MRYFVRQLLRGRGLRGAWGDVRSTRKARHELERIIERGGVSPSGKERGE